MLYDTRAGKPELDWSHIVIDNIRRYPKEFIEDHCPAGFNLESNPEANEDHGEQYYTELARAIETDNVMDVKRHNPARELRAPGDQSGEAHDAYRELVSQIFLTPETVVTPQTIDSEVLQEDLERIKARGKLYYDPDEEDGA